MENLSKEINELHVLENLSESKKEYKLLFVHGAWHGAWCWDEFFLPYFKSKGYSYFALDLRSHGKSRSKKYFKFT